MAKPDLEDGYLRVAHELDAALACGGFGRDERIVLHEVFAMIFGPAKLRTFDLSPSAIGERYGLPKQSIGRAVTSLLDSSVLVRDGLSFRFQKDYERWTWKGGPMLTTTMIQACRKAPKRAISHVNKNVDGSENSASTNSLTPAQKSSSKTLTNNGTVIDSVNKFDDAPSTNALTTVNEFVDAAHYEERAGLRIEKSEKGEREDARTPDPDEMTTGRKGEEHRLFIEAMRILEAHKPTAFLAPQLVMAADTPGIRSLPSWRLMVAVAIVQKPDKPKRWDTFLRSAQNATRDEFDRLPRSGGAVLGGSSPAAKSSHVERKATADDEARSKQFEAAMRAKFGGQPKAAS